MIQVEKAFQNLAKAGDSLQSLRDAAFDELTRLEVPSKKNEEWKYTAPKSFLDANWDVALEKVSFDLSNLPLYQMQSQSTLVFVDGRLRQDLSKGSIKTSSLNSTMLSKFGSKPEFFERLNLALLNDGVHIELEAKQYSDPILFLFVSSDKLGQPAVNYRVTVRVPTNSKASILEAHLGSASSTSQTVTQISLEKNSTLAYVKVNGAGEARQLGSTQFLLARDAKLESTQITLGGAVVRNHLSVLFAEEGSEAVLNGLYLANGSEHVDHQTVIDHAVGNTTSSQLYKGVLDDNARGVFIGGVRIRKDAQKANSSQLNNNLMLSQKAEIDTKPELEIEADDVKAAHGATIGQINPEHVFYLQSRALSEKQAVEMLAYGFAQDIVDRISDEKIRTEVSLLVKHKFSSFKVGV